MEDGSLVVPKIWNQPLFQNMVPVRLQSMAGPLVLLGSPAEIEFLHSGFAAAGRDVRGINWDWEAKTDLSSIPAGALVIVCKLPQDERHWRVVKQLKQQFGSRVIGIQELVLPFTTLQQGQASFDYSVDTEPDLARR